MDPPQGFKLSDGNMTYKLKKSIYGLKQASRAFRKHLSGILERLRGAIFSSDPSLFFFPNSQSYRFSIVHVDDLLVVGEKKTDVDSLTTAIDREVEIRVEHTDEKFLGMNIEHDIQ